MIGSRQQFVKTDRLPSKRSRWFVIYHQSYPKLGHHHLAPLFEGNDGNVLVDDGKSHPQKSVSPTGFRRFITA